MFWIILLIAMAGAAICLVWEVGRLLATLVKRR